jgi:hypothetical protein
VIDDPVDLELRIAAVFLDPGLGLSLAPEALLDMTRLRDIETVDRLVEALRSVNVLPVLFLEQVG